jgi:hypothetical protein
VHNAYRKHYVRQDELAGAHPVMMAVQTEEVRDSVRSVYASVSWADIGMNEIDLQHRPEEMHDSCEV